MMLRTLRKQIAIYHERYTLGGGTEYLPRDMNVRWKAGVSK